MAQGNGSNGNGGDETRPAGRRRRSPARAEVEVTATAAADDDAPVYRSDDFRSFLRRWEGAQSDLHSAQADLREIYKAETDRGLNRVAAKLALSWHSKILNDKMTAAEAYENLDAIRTLLDWMGHDVEARDLVVRMEDERSTTPPILMDTVRPLAPFKRPPKPEPWPDRSLTARQRRQGRQAKARRAPKSAANATRHNGHDRAAQIRYLSEVAPPWPPAPCAKLADVWPR